ncbi:molybdate ABC transporter substrate-binding protein [Neobacillus muris]|uniref:molybdate ABC transporter substrate-binding protein n=1 Tax=Neobacillus muris TaxID=2941334 RepID=UPI002041D025|nr:molybdate ABC transporter substrate-binding protein [Neobacillus muris]
MLHISIRKQLRDFSVELTEKINKETLVIIGHSGCGKSSTLRMLTGLVEPDDGQIELGGQMLFNTKSGVNLPPEKRNIGFVFQNYALFPHLTVTENILYGIGYLSADEKQERLLEVFTLLGINHLAHARPSMLSGGEQQRVAIARALVTRPKLLLFDEPLSALDVSTRTRVRAELKDLLRTLGIPSIVVTHDYEDARVLGDRIAVMDQGKIIQSGTADEIAKYPASHFVAQFTGTNLLCVEDTSQYAAVSPWHMKLSRQRGETGQDFIWKGKIIDMSWLGGFVRFHLEGDSNLLADIASETVETEQFQVGETVYASVAHQHARMLSHTPQPVKKSKQEGMIHANSKKGKVKWAVFASLAAAVIASIALTSGGNHNSTEAAEEELIAMVAANATDPFKDILEHTGTKAKTTFAGTQVLRTQIEQGAKTDLFLSADISHIEALQKEGLVDEYQPVSHGHEVIVVEKGNPKAIKEVKDLADKPIKLIIGVDTVPIGKYTRQIFKNADEVYGNQFTENTMAHVVSMESDVKQVLQKVALGEADAGVVYRSDVTSKFQEKVEIVEIPASINAESTNYITVPKNAPNPQAGQSLLNFMVSPEGQAIFAKYGYDPLKKEEMK